MVAKVLVLNAFYEPCRIVTWERAVCLLYDNKAEIVETVGDEVLRSPSVTMPMPSVIRQTRKTRSRKVSIKFSRQNVYSRDGYACQYCGAQKDAHLLNYDHVLPRARGGKTTWENIVAACFPCNTRKGDRTPEEAKMPLKRNPRKPAWLPIISKRFDVKTIPENWRPYLAEAA